MTDYKNNVLQEAYERGYQRGVRLAQMGGITVLILESNYDDSFISKVMKTSIEEVDLVRIAIRMFEGGEDIYFVARYTKFKIEEVEKIKDCIISEKKV